MLAAALVFLAASILVSAAVMSVPERAMRLRIRRSCLVACKDGQTFSGVLFTTDRGCVVLKNASMVGDDGSAAVDGEVVIFRADIAFVQFA